MKVKGKAGLIEALAQGTTGKGTTFSRAPKSPRTSWALAPEGLRLKRTRAIVSQLMMLRMANDQRPFLACPEQSEGTND